MTGNSLEATVNVYGETPLHYAAIAGNIPVIKILVTTNRALLQKENSYGLNPLHYAAQNCHKEAVSFLLSETDYHQDPSPFTGEKGATLVNLFIIADFYDEALHLLRRYPNLAIQKDNKGKTALETLAKKPHAFPSGSKLGFCERLIYRFASVNADDVPRGGDLESTVDSSKENQKESKKFGFLHNIKNTNMKHNQALHLLRLLITEALKARPSETRMLLKKPLQISARLGIYEMVVEIIKAYPRSDWVVDRDGNNIFNLAIVHRQEFFFSLLKRPSPHTMHLVTASTDKNGDNILHLAARLGPSNETLGAALQMHSEMKWFKDVENVVQPIYREMINHEGWTPREIFSKQHKTLVG
ncbi:hypothetical protein P3X46_001603 [Hevea brasiliensis]|uniref:PGG domain-containing protein n=1 Tax=Hevea brasiliensis TaxID=3981 RepID=A0ABQ9NF83_HEVBR|nr:hypothetical protein P3X46_001603 [Hevea brasiliensis]